MTDFKLSQGDWDDTLNSYLEGRALRADAEDLLMRINLAPSERDHIERSLRLSDELTFALRAIQLPGGAEQRLLGKLRGSSGLQGAPSHWRMTAAGDFVRDAVAMPLPMAEEDLVDAAVEGRISLKELLARQAAGELSDEAAEALDVLEATSEAVTSASPAAQVGQATTRRLMRNLRAHMNSAAGELDAKVVERLLGGAGRSADVAMPDVMAAEETPGED